MSARHLLCALLLCVPATAEAQHDHATMTMPAQGWTWKLDGQASLNLNLQQRKFTDVHQVESQNWFMAMGGRRVGNASLSVHAMFSLEPFTMRELGSAEVFQTGETFDRRPLIDFQHPHDLFMGLGATLGGAAGANAMWSVTAAVVGEATLGPTAFMHRISSEANPTAPLGHHTLDSTHITHGVVAGGLTFGEVTIESSVFHGREPDENRLDIEMGALDSYAGRVWWRRGAWNVQASAGHLVQPDPTETSDLNRYTASIEYAGATAWKPFSFTLAAGLNHHPELSGDSLKEYAVLFDAAWRVRARDLIYMRAELADKDILEAGGYDPPAFTHPHPISRVGALTLGYQRRIAAWGRQTLGLGGDVTVYRTPENLLSSYGHPVSVHVLLILKRQ